MRKGIHYLLPILIALMISVHFFPFNLFGEECPAKESPHDIQNPGTDILTLHKALRLAIKHNPRLQAERSQKQAASYQVNVARSRFLPKIDIRESYLRSDSPVQVFSNKLAQQSFASKDFDVNRLNSPSPRTNLKTEFVLTQPLFNRGIEIHGYKTAKLYEQMADTQEEQLKQKILLNVEEAYLSWLLSIEKHKVIKKAVQTALRNLRVAQSRFKIGTVLKSDVLQAQVHLSSFRKSEIAAKNGIKIALSTLNVTMGFAPGTKWIPTFSETTVLNDQHDIAFWMNQTLTNRPELTFYKLNTEIAKWGVRKAKMNFLPSLNLKGVYEYNSEGIGGVSGDAFTLMGVAELNAFKGLGDRSEFQKAVMERERAKSLQKAVKQGIEQQVQKAWLNLETAKAQITVTKEAAGQARESLRIIQKRYHNGLAIITELLDNETALLKAKLEHLRAVYDYQMAWAQMKWTAGVMSDKERENK